MPSLQEIETIKSILNELGGEPEVLAERGEAIEDVGPPQEDQGAPPAQPQGQGRQPGSGAARTATAPSPRRGAARGAVPEVPPDESFDASAMVGSEEELDSLDSFEDFDFESWSAGAGAAERAGAAGGAAAGAEPEAPGGPAEEEPFAGFEGAEDVEREPEIPGVESQEMELPGEELAAEGLPEAPAEGLEASEEDVLAALGLSGEDFAGGEPAESTVPPEPWKPEEAPAEPSMELELPEMPEVPTEEEPWLPEPEAESDEFGIPPGLLGPESQDQGEAGPPEAEAAAPAEVGAAQEAGQEPFDFTEELGDLEGLFAAAEEEAPEEGSAFGQPPGIEETGTPEEAPVFDEALLADQAVVPDEAVESEQGGPFEEGGAFGEEPFELPEEFRLPEEPGVGPEEEEAPLSFEEEGEAPAPPSEEEAEFLRALQEEILPGEGGEPPAPAPAAEHVDLEEPAGEGEAEGADEELVYDEFSLEGLGEEFGLSGEGGEEEQVPPEAPGFGAEEAEIPGELPAELRAELGAEAAAVPEEALAAGGPPEVEAPGREAGEAALAELLRLSDKQFAALRRNLRRLPRNLKIAVEELIGERELAGPDLQGLVSLLAEGAAPAAIASEVSRITGTRIAIPKSFEKLTGLEFEAELRSFAYAFRQNILPVLRVAFLSLAVVAVLGFLGYRFVYRPVRAEILYRQGHSQIERQRYQLANERFEEALSYWVFKGWFYRYAEAFRGERQYTLAADKYEGLLRKFPQDRKGALDYAGLLTFDLAGYEHADELLKGLLERDLKDRDALLARGDNFLQWAADSPQEEAAALYEKARFSYASIIDYYGQQDDVLLRMMRYFIRTDRLKETEDLKAFLDRAPLKGVSAETYASVYAELAGYWMTNNRYDGVTDMLFAAMDADPQVPEIFYNLGRFYNHVGNTPEEQRALKSAVDLLEATQPLTKGRLFTLIDAHRRYGESFWRQQEYLLAGQQFEAAIERIEDVQKQEIFGTEKMFGQVYEDQGDISYYVSRDLTGALDYYRTAVQNGHRPPRLDYKIGYIEYTGEDIEDALLRFSAVVDREPRNENALFALGNSLYLAGFYSAAQGYYLRLLDLLETRRERIPLLLINENPEHRALAEAIMKTYNNLGVTLYRLGRQRRDQDKESSALVNLTFSSEEFDMLSRDPETAERGITRNLAYLNQRGILYPESGFEPQLYLRIPIDMQVSGQ